MATGTAGARQNQPSVPSSVLDKTGKPSTPAPKVPVAVRFARLGVADILRLIPQALYLEPARDKETQELADAMWQAGPDGAPLIGQWKPAVAQAMAASHLHIHFPGRDHHAAVPEPLERGTQGYEKERSCQVDSPARLNAWANANAAAITWAAQLRAMPVSSSTQMLDLPQELWGPPYPAPAFFDYHAPLNRTVKSLCETICDDYAYQAGWHPHTVPPQYYLWAMADFRVGLALQLAMSIPAIAPAYLDACETHGKNAVALEREILSLVREYRIAHKLDDLLHVADKDCLLNSIRLAYGVERPKLRAKDVHGRRQLEIARSFYDALEAEKSKFVASYNKAWPMAPRDTSKRRFNQALQRSLCQRVPELAQALAKAGSYDEEKRIVRAICTKLHDDPGFSLAGPVLHAQLSSEFVTLATTTTATATTTTSATETTAAAQTTLATETASSGASVHTTTSPGATTSTTTALPANANPIANPPAMMEEKLRQMSQLQALEALVELTSAASSAIRDARVSLLGLADTSECTVEQGLAWRMPPSIGRRYVQAVQAGENPTIWLKANLAAIQATTGSAKAEPLLAINSTTQALHALAIIFRIDSLPHGDGSLGKAISAACDEAGSAYRPGSIEWCDARCAFRAALALRVARSLPTILPKMQAYAQQAPGGGQVFDRPAGGLVLALGAAKTLLKVARKSDAAGNIRAIAFAWSTDLPGSGSTKRKHSQNKDADKAFRDLWEKEKTGFIKLWLERNPLDTPQQAERIFTEVVRETLGMLVEELDQILESGHSEKRTQKLILATCDALLEKIARDATSTDDSDEVVSSVSSDESSSSRQ